MATVESAGEEGIYCVSVRMTGEELRGVRALAHAVVVEVNLPESGRTEEGRRLLLDVVVPNAKAQPGFVSGIWMNNGEQGRAVVVFGTEEEARAALAHLKPPPGGPTLVSSEVYEVGAQA